MTVKNSNSVFRGNGDAIAYLLITSIFPLVNLLSTIWKLDSNIESTLSEVLYVFNCLFFLFAFVYDYYSRYEDVDGKKSKKIINTIFLGLLLFSLASGSLIVIFLFWITNLTSFQMVLIVSKISIYLCGAFSIVIAIIDIVKRTAKVHSGKLGNAAT